MPLNYFTFGDFQSLRDCNLYIEKRPSRQKPVRDVTEHEVPGRDGVVLVDNGRWKNIILRYQVGCGDIDANIDKINQMLCQTGVQILEDTYDADVYYKAVCINATEFQEDLLNFGRATIEFNCEPYRYLNEGKVQTVINNGAKLINPTGFEALPHIEIYASSGATCTLHFGSKNYTIKMPSNTNWLNIDSETMECYWGTTKYNDAVQFDIFPVLNPGETTVQFSTSSGKINVYITPRWRKI